MRAGAIRSVTKRSSLETPFSTGRCLPPMFLSISHSADNWERGSCYHFFALQCGITGHQISDITFCIFTHSFDVVSQQSLRIPTTVVKEVIACDVFSCGDVLFSKSA